MKAKTGIELIAQERQEQIEKHGRTVERDYAENPELQLLQGAHELLHIYPSELRFPKNWDKAIVHRMISKSIRDRLIIAGALIAAQLDVMEYDMMSEINSNQG